MTGGDLKGLSTVRIKAFKCGPDRIPTVLNNAHFITLIAFVKMVVGDQLTCKNIRSSKRWRSVTVQIVTLSIQGTYTFCGNAFEWCS